MHASFHLKKRPLFKGHFTVAKNMNGNNCFLTQYDLTDLGFQAFLYLFFLSKGLTVPLLQVNKFAF